MKNMILLISVFDDITELLISVGESNWAEAISSFRKRCNNSDPENFEQLRNEVLRIFSGMGSFNDLVLYKHDQPLTMENARLDKLRTELFRILTEGKRG